MEALFLLVSSLSSISASGYPCASSRDLMSADVTHEASEGAVTQPTGSETGAGQRWDCSHKPMRFTHGVVDVLVDSLDALLVLF